ncbi:MAG: 4Fe-4S cluster-binding domain-containing protein, partial [Bacillota bacterium]|nr:4Fe-4S cluster-binding domain-containing protein [Bacillota bacterium]
MDKQLIMPFHLFNHLGNNYLINIENMQACSVDEIIVKTIKLMDTEPISSIPPSIEATLKRLGLILEVKPDNRGNMEKAPIPIVRMALFLTQSCNLNCIYCYGDGGEYGTGGNLDMKTAFQAVDWLIKQAGKMKKVHLGFFGGEPFLNFSLMKAIVKYAKKRAEETGKDVAFNAASNATLLDDEKISFIKEHSISIMISFDGPKELQDAQRPYTNGTGSYDSTVPKIKRLLAAVPETPGHAVVVGDSDPQMVKNSLQQIGFKTVSISPVSQSLFSGEHDNKKSTRHMEMHLQALEQEAATWLLSIKSEDTMALKGLTARSELFGIYRGMVSLLHNNKRKYFCGAGRGLVAVSISGDIYLCHRFVGKEEYKLGNVFVNNLSR